MTIPTVGAIHELPLQKDLPEGWVWKTMGEISDVIGGGTPRTNVPEYFNDGDIPWITPADLSGYNNKYISHGSRFITETGLKNSSARLMPAGTVLFTSRAPIGYVAIAKNPVSTNQGFKSFVLKVGILPDYVYWYLKGNKNLAESNASGTTFLELSGTKAKQIPIPIAPLNQQKLIVAEIEKQFSRLDEAVTALKRIQANLQRYEASVLKAAVEGKLTEEWRRKNPDVESATDLLKRIVVERKKKWEADHPGKKYKEPAPPNTSNLPELPKGWVWTALSQIATFQNGRSFPSKEYSSKGIKLLRPGNLYADGSVKWNENNTRELPETWASKYPEYRVGGGELIMNLTAQSLRDEFLGRTCITGSGEHCLLNQRLARISPLPGIDVRFLLWVLKSKRFRNFVDTLNTGSLIQHMFTSDLTQFNFPLPPTDEQQEIVEASDNLLSVAEEIEKAVETTIKRAERLRQSILKKAFSGNLKILAL